MAALKKQLKFRDQQPLQSEPPPSVKHDKLNAVVTPVNTKEISTAATSPSAVVATTSAPTTIPAPTTYAQFDDINNYCVGIYSNWSNLHGALAAQSWCSIGDLMNFCDKYEYKSLSLTDVKLHFCICAEVKALLNGGAAPFDRRKRFPDNVREPEQLWVCIGRCAGIEYHLNRVLNVFRRPLERLSTDKQREARHNFHLAINELRLDISGRITEVTLYDRNVFEREFQLKWLDKLE